MTRHLFYRFILTGLILVTTLSLTGCGGAKGTVQTKKRKENRRSTYPDYQTGKPKNAGTVDYTEVSDLRQQVVDNALSYLGITYKYGGTTVNGMDCSGLIYTAHREANISVPRTSAAMYGDVRRVDLDEVVPGDLLFFGTGKNSKKVNHVGLITEVTGGTTYFVHSTTSGGVIVSALDEPYWLNAYVSAGKIR